MITHNLLGVRIDDLDDAKLEQQLERWLHESTFRMIVTPNPEFILYANKNTHFKSLLNKSDLSLPDGVGLRFGVAALTDEVIHHRHTGVDLVELLACVCSKNDCRVLLFGGAPNSAIETKKLLKRLYPTLEIESMDPGKIKGDVHSVDLSEKCIEDIRSYKPDVLIVALGQGKQEQCIDQIREIIPTLRIAVGVGGAFDTLSGNVPRAPYFLRKSGLEWMWRVFIEPKRFLRIWNAVIVFPAVIVWGTLRQRRFFRACRNVFPEIYHQLTDL